MAAFDTFARYRRFGPATAVAVVHVAIGYALISGLAMNVLKRVPPVFTVQSIRDDTPPPPVDMPKPLPRAEATRPTVVTPLVQTPVETVTTIDLQPVETRPIGPIAIDPMPLPPEPPQPPARDLSRGAAPKGNRAGWITNDDYPADAIRAEAAGVVGFHVAIGANGHVTACSVTQSSGFRALDRATCSLYGSRAQFEPARGKDGQPIASERDDKVTWQLP